MVDHELQLRRISKKHIQIYSFEEDFIVQPTKSSNKGSYGLVVPAKIKKTSQNVVLKLSLNYEPLLPIPADILKEIIFLQHLNQFPETKTVEFYGIAFTQDYKNLYLVLEELDYDLDSIKKNDMSPAQYRLLFWKILNAFHAIHCVGVIHNDIKLPNIMRKGYDIRIIDFGFAEFLSVGPVVELVSNYKCTEVTKAPDSSDQADFGYKSKNRKSYATDMYSIGASMVHLITKRYEKLQVKNDNIRNGIYNDEDGSFLKLGDITTKLDSPHALGPTGYDLLLKIMRPNTHRRWCAKRALQHPYFAKGTFGEGIENLAQAGGDGQNFALLYQNYIGYSAREYTKRQMELCYLEEIHQNYIDDKVILVKIPEEYRERYNSEMDSFIERYLANGNRFAGIDTVINSILSIRNRFSEIYGKGRDFQLIAGANSRIYLSIFSYDGVYEDFLVEGLRPKKLANILLNKIILPTEANFNIYPISAHIMYIYLKLQHEIDDGLIYGLLDEIYTDICRHLIHWYIQPVPFYLELPIWDVVIFCALLTLSQILKIDIRELNRKPLLDFLLLDSIKLEHILKYHKEITE